MKFTLEKDHRTNKWKLYADGRIVIITVNKNIAEQTKRDILSGKITFDPLSKGVS